MHTDEDLNHSQTEDAALPKTVSPRTLICHSSGLNRPDAIIYGSTSTSDFIGHLPVERLQLLAQGIKSLQRCIPTARWDIGLSPSAENLAF